MRPLSNALATAAVFSIAHLAVAAPGPAPISSFVTSGTIDQGVDALGLFGKAGAVLDGQQFSMTVSIDTSTLLVKERMPYENYWWSAGDGSIFGAAAMAGTYTVAGHTYEWSTDNAAAQLRLQRNLSATGQWVDWASLGGGGIAADGLHVIQGSMIYSGTTAFLHNIDPAHPTNFGPYLGSADMWSFSNFEATAPDGTRTSFLSNTPLATARWVTSPVPEPGRYAMLLAGLGLLAFGLRKQRGERRRAAIGTPAPANRRRCARYCGSAAAA